MTEWKRHHGGKGWSYEKPSGYIQIEGEEENPRTKGAALSAAYILEDFFNDIKEAQGRFPDVSWATIVAIICCEANKLKHPLEHGSPSIAKYHRDIKSPRWEPKPKVYSAGLMQTLTSTATRMNKKYDLVYNGSKIDPHDLMNPRASILLGTAYLSDIGAKHDHDPVKAQAAYNAGSVKKTTKNPWRMLTYSPNRTEKYIRYHNDAVFALKALAKAGGFGRDFWVMIRKNTLEP